MEQMKMEFPPRTPENDEEAFAEIDRLVADGWETDGNIFEKDQRYHFTLHKGNERRDFVLTKPYPKSIPK